MSPSHQVKFWQHWSSREYSDLKTNNLTTMEGNINKLLAYLKIQQKTTNKTKSIIMNIKANV